MGISDKIIADRNTIEEYIPQRAPIVMISNLHSCNEKETITSFFIEKDNIFCEKGVLKEPGIIENIAQSAASGVGYLCHLEKRAVPIGFIGSVDNFYLYSCPMAGTTIQTKISVGNEIFGVTLIKGEVTQGKDKIAECGMKIFILEEEKK